MTMVNDELLKDLLWMSCRYCIGRHSYVGTYAKDMSEYFYDKLTDDEKLKNAKDIRQCIRNSLRYEVPTAIKNEVGTRDISLEQFFEYCNSHDLKEADQFHDMYETDILDLTPWMDLASLFDINSHVMVSCVDEENNKYTVRCYPSYTNETVQDKNGFWRAVPWKYKKIYRPVDKLISNVYVEPTMITNIQNI